MIEVLKSQYPSLDVLKKFPDSSQKWVYLVQMKSYGKLILKIIKNMNERIEREIDIITTDRIKGVPEIFKISTFEYNGETFHYLLEEFIEGKTLSILMKENTISISKALKLLETLLLIVVELENIGIIHRDIKPDNILCAPDDSFHLIDFGIARDTRRTSLTLTDANYGPHTPGYGAPELFLYNKKMIDSRADLFSIGVVVYETIFAKHPFITGSEVDIQEIWYKTLTQIADAGYISGDTDSQMSSFLATLIQKSVSRRPPNAKTALRWFYSALQTMSL